MRLRTLTTLACLTALVAGCQTTNGVLLCDVEEARPFPSREVLEYRIANDRENVIRDVRTNENLEEYCSG